MYETFSRLAWGAKSWCLFLALGGVARMVTSLRLDRRCVGVFGDSDRSASRERSWVTQGQSVKHVGLDLRIPVFAHGQLYVALSRATKSSNIKILLPEYAAHESTTPNVVYNKILL